MEKKFGNTLTIKIWFLHSFGEGCEIEEHLLILAYDFLFIITQLNIDDLSVSKNYSPFIYIYIFYSFNLYFCFLNGQNT